MSDTPITSALPMISALPTKSALPTPNQLKMVELCTGDGYVEGMSLKTWQNNVPSQIHLYLGSIQFVWWKCSDITDSLQLSEITLATISYMKSHNYHNGLTSTHDRNLWCIYIINCDGQVLSCTVLRNTKF